jgi:hypothetical protein
VRAWLGLSIFFCAAISLRAETSVEIDLQEQMAYLLRDGRPVLASPISSGRYGHLTKTGSFKVLEKERNHHSSMYGKIADARGNTVVTDADADMPVPRGGKFIPLRCITSCVLPALMECTPDICQDIPLPTGVFGCRNSWQLRSSIPSMLVLLSPC